MPSGNEVTVSVSSTSPVTVTVPGSTGTTPTITNGGTANVTITSVGDRGPQGTPGTNGTSGTFADAQSINAQTASYTLVLSDAGKLITATSSSASVVITIPAASSVSFSSGTHIDFARLGTSPVRISGASGVTVNGTPGTALRAQYSAATAICLGTNNWLVVGDLSA
jgi:hypothetical protein